MTDRLVDTQSLIWFLEDDRRLSVKVKKLMEAESSRLFVSIASLWEMAIKMSLKKLVLSVDFSTMVERTRENGFELLPVEPEHLVTLMSLEFIHRDPFDRLIIAQALTENMPLISSDDIFERYPVQREWA
ncbi:MAG: type II toxin-antitoxin system VapC family toxin [Spirochaetaceae bacterium]|jgi:PIN domain nuclease of toxin-antitoxin system|nr:type II toxin-antitoxin system VapC family toxin [Spirochaetaceae bacterium]